MNTTTTVNVYTHLLAGSFTDTSSFARDWFIRASGLEPENWWANLKKTRPMIPTEGAWVDPEDFYTTEEHWRSLIEYKPRTPLGRRLMAVRARIIASGTKLLSWDEIERELMERRGERRRTPE